MMTWRVTAFQILMEESLEEEAKRLHAAFLINNKDEKTYGWTEKRKRKITYKWNGSHAILVMGWL